MNGLIAELKSKFAAIAGDAAPTLARAGFDAEDVPVGELVAARTYDSEAQLYTTEECTGFLLEMPPLPGITESAGAQFADLTASLEGLPAWCMQVTLFALPAIGGALADFAAPRQGGGVVTDIARKRTGMFARAAFDGLAREYPWRPRRHTVLIWVSVAGSGENRKKELLAARTRVTEVLRSAGAFADNVRPGRLLSFYSLLLAPPTEDVMMPERTWNKYDPLNMQVSRPGCDLFAERGQLRFAGNVAARLFAVSEIPEFCLPGSMTGLLGDPWAERLYCPHPYAVTTIIRPSGVSRELLGPKAARVEKNAQSPLRLLMPSIVDQAQDFGHVMRSLDEGKQLVRLMMRACVFAPEGGLDSAETSLRAVFKHNGLRFNAEAGAQTPGFMSMLPLGAEPRLLKALDRFGRTRTVLSHNAVCLAPVFGEWRGNAGNRPPLLMLAGRRGELAGWTPFQSDGNYNVAVVGKSGAGKSVLMQDLLCGMVSTGGSAVVIDDGYSFVNSCRFFGGTHIDTADANMRVNPFASLDKDVMARDTDFAESAHSMLASMLGAMCRPGRDLGDVERALMTGAVSSVWAVKGNRGRIDDVAAVLQEDGSAVAKELVVMLKPFCTGGAYGRVFNEGCNIDLDSPLVVFELSSLRDKKEMQAAVMMFLVFLATQKMYNSDRGHPVAIVIDEAWALLAGAGAGFVEGVARRARKYSGSLITGTQSVSDYFNNPAAEAAWANSDWVLLLAQKDSSVQTLKTEKKINVTENLERVLRSLKPVRDMWSEVMIYGGGGYDVFRLVLDPLSLAVFTSSGDDIALLDKLKASGMSEGGAIRELAAQKTAERDGGAR